MDFFQINLESLFHLEYTVFMTGLLTRIKDISGEFNAAEQRIASHIITNPNDIFTLSIGQLAKRSGSSEAGIVRFCKKLGFDGFKSIKSALAKELITSSKKKMGEESYSDIKNSDSSQEIIGKVVLNHVRAIEETANILDMAAFDRAVDLLFRAKRVDIFGFGASGLVAQDMQQKFIRIGKYCSAYADIHLQLTAAASLTGDDAAVFISYSGNTKDIISCLGFVRGLGVPTVAITKCGSGNLGRMADIALRVCSPEIAVRSGATSSRITQLALVDMLFISVAGRRYEEAQEMLRRSFEGVQDRKYQ
jgi:DNA-binding MurR/RpiR family transcriptional regulator